MAVCGKKLGIVIIIVARSRYLYLSHTHTHIQTLARPPARFPPLTLTATVNICFMHVSIRTCESANYFLYRMRTESTIVEYKHQMIWHDTELCTNKCTSGEQFASNEWHWHCCPDRILCVFCVCVCVQCMRPTCFMHSIGKNIVCTSYIRTSSTSTEGKKCNGNVRFLGNMGKETAKSYTLFNPIVHCAGYPFTNRHPVVTDPTPLNFN